MKLVKRALLVILTLFALGVGALALMRVTGGLLMWNEPNPAAFELFGVDVSSYQGEVDWGKLREQGVDFAFVKATEGSGMTDVRFAANWAGAGEAGVMAGAYHFFSYDSPGETQADNFIAAVPVTPGALPPVVDVEFYGDYLTEPKPAEEVKPILDALLVRLEAWYGQKPILYATERAYRLYLADGYEGYPLWLTFPSLNPFWRDWSFWQYSHHAQMEGYEGKEQYIDLNVFRGTAEELAALGLDPGRLYTAPE